MQGTSLAAEAAKSAWLAAEATVTAGIISLQITHWVYNKCFQSFI